METYTKITVNVTYYCTTLLDMYALSPTIHACVPTITSIGIVCIHNIMVVVEVMTQ